MNEIIPHAVVAPERLERAERPLNANAQLRVSREAARVDGRSFMARIAMERDAVDLGGPQVRPACAPPAPNGVMSV